MANTLESSPDSYSSQFQRGQPWDRSCLKAVPQGKVTSFGKRLWHLALSILSDGSHFQRVEMRVGEGTKLDSLQKCPERSRSVPVFLRAQASWGLLKGSPYLRRESVVGRSNKWPRCMGIGQEDASSSKCGFSLLTTDVFCCDRS